MDMTMARAKLKNEIKDYVFVTLGTAMYAFAWAIFLLPYEIVSGGVTGLSAIIFYATKIPIEYSYFTINAILLLIALKILGLKFMTKTIYAIFMLSFFLKVGQMLVIDDKGNFIQLLGPGQDFMSLLIACSMIGTGLAIVFLHNGSTGGTDIIAACVNKYKPISLGRVLIAVDLCIIGSSIFIFQDYRKLVFGLCTMVIMNFVLDYVMNARRESVQFLIFSKRYKEVAEALTKEVRHGITLLDGQGYYTGDDVKVICLITKKRESVTVFRTIKMVDPKAFVSQSAVIGVYGEGFDTIKVKLKKDS
ncbi:MAG: YitT family protein [Prevotella sp.]|nr:YitT family protein [Prevotella sp.]